MPTTAKSRRATRGDSLDPMAQFIGLGSMTTSMAAASQAYMDAIGQCQGEICSFVTKRLSTDFGYGQKLAKCQDWQQAAAVQQEWAQQAVQDYVGEGQKLFQLGAGAVNSGISKE